MALHSDPLNALRSGGLDEAGLIDDLFADDPLLALSDKADFAEMSDFVDALMSPSHSAFGR